MAVSSLNHNKKPARTLRRKALKALVIAALALALCELALRIAFHPGFEFLRLTGDDPYQWSRFRPGADEQVTVKTGLSILRRNPDYRYRVRINSQGLRADRDYAPRPAAGTLRVVCLGDSITFGWGVEGGFTWPALLEALLNRTGGTRAEVINAGMPGYTSRQGLIWADRELLGLQPTVLIVQFGFNDSLSSWLRMSGPIFLGPDREVMSGSPGAWDKIPTGGIRGLTRIMHDSHLGRISLVIYTLARKQFGDAGAGPYSLSRVPPADFQANLLELSRLCRDKGVRMIVLDSWGTPPAYREVISTLEAGEGMEVVSQAELMDRALRALRPIIEDGEYRPLVERIRERLGGKFLEDNPRYYLLVDELHPSELGNELLAEKLKPLLVRVEAGGTNDLP